METKDVLIRLKEESGFNWKEFSDYFGIPYRTMQDWYLGKRKMPDYLLHLMAYKVELEKKYILRRPFDEIKAGSGRNHAEQEAFLSSFDRYTTFSFGETTLTFRTCDHLERYTKVILWDHGYIEVMAKYLHKSEEIEEYIDLEPVLDSLFMDKESFLEPIKKVSIRYV